VKKSLISNKEAAAGKREVLKSVKTNYRIIEINNKHSKSES